tara:strand:- start:414 stop:641 length:228 start_codon:yes stop_codon:yes gene_type:complete
MKSENCWVWFKGSLKEKGVWKGGFKCQRDENPGFLVESPSFVSCRLPDWRIAFEEPLDASKGPSIPTNAEWKLQK